MIDLTPDRVRALADALGLPLSPEDLDEVTHRLNAILHALAPLAELPIDSVEPVPAWMPHAGASTRRTGRTSRARSAKSRASLGTRDPDGSIVHQSAADLAALIRARALSPVALVEAYLERIERLDGDLRAYITVCGESARAEATRAEEAVARGEITGALHGLPFAVKDQFDTAGLRTTSGSRLLADNVSAADAPVVARLRAAGGILLGKLNMTEFALGGTLDFPFGQPRNPWNRLHDLDTKAMTAFLCGILVDEGKLKWGQTLGETFPELKKSMHPQYHAVTLEQLLTHRGGEAGDLAKDELWGQLWQHNGTPTSARDSSCRASRLSRPKPHPARSISTPTPGTRSPATWPRKSSANPGKTSRAKSLPPARDEHRRLRRTWHARDERSTRGHKADGSPVEPGPGADNPVAIGPAGIVHCSIGDWAKFAAANLPSAKTNLLKPETLEMLPDRPCPCLRRSEIR